MKSIKKYGIGIILLQVMIFFSTQNVKSNDFERTVEDDLLLSEQSLNEIRDNGGLSLTSVLRADWWEEGPGGESSGAGGFVGEAPAGEGLLIIFLCASAYAMVRLVKSNKKIQWLK